MERFAKLNDGRNIYVEYNLNSEPTFYCERAIEGVMENMLHDQIEMFDTEMAKVSSVMRDCLEAQKDAAIHAIKYAKYILL